MTPSTELRMASEEKVQALECKLYEGSDFYLFWPLMYVVPRTVPKDSRCSINICGMSD